MLLTESEAKARWCPHARIPLYAASPADEESPASANRPMPGTSAYASNATQDATRCIASGCMAWRFAQMEPPRFVVRELDPVEMASWQRERAGEAGYLEVTARDPQEPVAIEAVTRLGYCGLAG